MTLIHDRYSTEKLYANMNFSMQGLPNNCSAGVVACISSRGGQSSDPRYLWESTTHCLPTDVEVSSFDEYIKSYAMASPIYRLPLHFMYVRLLEGMWLKTSQGRIPDWVSQGVPFHAGNGHNIWMWIMSDQDHDWDNQYDEPLPDSNRNTTGPNICSFMNWIESQQPNGLIGKIEISPWTRSTHKYGRVRTAVYQPSTYTGEYIKKELAKVNEHMKAVAELLPAKDTLLEDDPICNLWRE